MQFLCCYEGKTLLQIETHLVAKTTQGSCTGAVGFFFTRIKNMLKQIEVLLHKRKVQEFGIWKTGFGGCVKSMGKIILFYKISIDPLPDIPPGIHSEQIIIRNMKVTQFGCQSDSTCQL